MRKPTKEIQLTSYDDLLGINGSEISAQGKVVKVPLNELYPFKNHPFQVSDDEEMDDLVESIQQHGVLNPVIVRPRPEGGYEIISGHRRKRGSELAGLPTLPVLIQEYSDDEAVIIMVNANIQRENILPSEKAFAYKMKMEALRHQGMKDGKGENTAELVGKKAGDSGRKVQRYIRLTELLPELLEMVDKKKLNFISAVSLSYLTKEEQEWVVQCITEKRVSISGKNAEELKKYSTEKRLTRLAVELVLFKEKKESRKLSFSEERVNRYFPAEYSKEQMEEVICRLLEEWSKNEIPSK